MDEKAQSGFRTLNLWELKNLLLCVTSETSSSVNPRLSKTATLYILVTQPYFQCNNFKIDNLEIVQMSLLLFQMFREVFNSVYPTHVPFIDCPASF